MDLGIYLCLFTEWFPELKDSINKVVTIGSANGISERPSENLIVKCLMELESCACPFFFI